MLVIHSTNKLPELWKDFLNAHEINYSPDLFLVTISKNLPPHTVNDLLTFQNILNEYIPDKSQNTKAFHDAVVTIVNEEMATILKLSFP